MADGFRGILPFVGGVEGDAPPSGGIVSQSSLSVLFSGGTRSSGAASLVPSLSLTWESPQSPSGFRYVFPFVGGMEGVEYPALQITATGTLSFGSKTFVASRVTFPSTLNTLWEGTQLRTPGAFSFSATGSVLWLSQVGSAFEFIDTQNSMNPSGMAIASATVVSGSSASALWTPAQVPFDASFSITPTGSVVFEFSSVSSGAVSIPTVVTAVFASSTALGTAAYLPTALSATWEGIELVTQTAVGIIASSTVGWISLPAIFENVELGVDSRSFVLFDGQELMMEAPFFITANSRIKFRSTPPTLGSDDDDVYRREVWRSAAEEEARLREKIAAESRQDEDDLMVLVAALSAAYEHSRIH